MNMKLLKSNDVPSEVISHDVSPLTVNTDAGAYSKLGWLIVLLGVGGFLLWAVFAPLDKGVPLSGSVTKESSRKAIAHLSGGTIDDILVKDGDVVKAGQTLVRMNAINAKSASDIARSQLHSDLATMARLMAERDGKKTLVFPAQLLAAKDDPRVQSNMETQRELFSARQLALQNELSGFDQNIAGIRQQIEGMQASRESKKVQIGFLNEQLTNVRELSKEGYVARSRLLDLERNAAQLNGALAEDAGNIGRAQHQVLELEMRRSQRLQDVQKEVRTQLTDVTKEADSLQSRLAALDFDLANTEIKAPVDGIVVGVNVHTRGGVVAPGFKMMDLVPVNDPLVVEGQLPINLIDKVHAGLEVELIFSAFNSSTTPHIPGVITTVGADRSVDEKSGAPYYKVSAKVTPEGAKLVASKRLAIQPGMPVEMFVKTGERTMMSYLFKPLLDRAKISMTEE
jgi:protease secretion system membrane fusion protein